MLKQGPRFFRAPGPVAGAGDVAKRSASEPRPRPLSEWRIEPRARRLPEGQIQSFFQ